MSKIPEWLKPYKPLTWSDDPWPAFERQFAEEIAIKVLLFVPNCRLVEHHYNETTITTSNNKLILWGAGKYFMVDLELL